MKPIIKLILSPVIGVLVGVFYSLRYNFSIEAASISALITMVLIINILNLLDNTIKGKHDG